MNNLKAMKDDYIRNVASDALKGRVATVFEETPEVIRGENRRRPWQNLGVVAAGLVLILTATLNLSPSFADTVAKMPGMERVVHVLTLGRYVVDEEGYQARIEMPVIQGLVDKALQDQLNAEFQQESQVLIAAFEADMTMLKEQFPGETVHMGIDSGYTIRTDNEDYLALDVYSVNVVGSSSTTHKFYTVDKKTNQLVTLPQLFKDGADYVTSISTYLLDEMRRQNITGENTYWTDEAADLNFRAIKANQKFFIDDKNQLVIAFDKYEVGPGASGCPEFVIPRAIIEGILK